MKKASKPKILVLSDYYLPGYKSGGGMRTIVNMVERLHDRFDFYIITRDHDGPQDKQSYENVKIDGWNNIENAKVFYLPKNKIKLSKLRELISEVAPDSIYTNSYFATLAVYMLTLRKLGMIPKYNVIIAPCGELSDGALSLKTKKKKLFMGVSKISDLYEDVIWKASNDIEKSEIERANPKPCRIFVAPDLTPKKIYENYDRRLKPKKTSGEAKMIFLSRFSRKKNFKWLLELLPKIAGKLTIDVFGPIEDEDYWLECVEIIKNLPPNIKVESKGTVSHEKVSETLVKYHFFVLPTLGENFGHVFLEALAAGCPLLISNLTPWLDLEKKNTGWDISLDKPDEWIAKINHCISLEEPAYSVLSDSARQFAVQWLENNDIEEDTLRVLEYSLSNTLEKSA
jgi:glycosyltransferase involved in cell wall biosynthesis